MAKEFDQKVTFIGTLEIKTEGMNWEAAKDQVERAMSVANGGNADFFIDLVKVIRMEIPEED